VAWGGQNVRVHGVPNAVFSFTKFCKNSALLRGLEISGHGVERIPYRLLHRAHIVSNWERLAELFL
jgi:hypothetical protein